MKVLSTQDLSKLSHIKQILFACFCAEQVQHLVLPKDKAACERAIAVAYLFIEGKATQEECRVAADAADAAADAAAYVAAAAAAYVAAYAAYATTYAAAAADAAYASANASSPKDRAAIIEAQWAFYDQLLNGDKYFEEIVLREE